ncbi:MAG: ubiquitin-like domain-containing protein [Bacillota bacterium]
MDWYVVARRRGIRHQETEAQPEETTGRRSRLRLAIIVFAVVLAGLAVAGYAWAKKEVVLVVDGKKVAVQTFQMNVGGLLEQEQVELGPKDLVLPGKEAPLRDGMQVKIVRALPVTVEVDGKTRRLLTQAKTVAELLKEEQIELGKEDIVSPALDSKLAEAGTVKIIRVSREVQEKEVPVPFTVKKKYTASMLKGQTKVLASGKDGLAVERWEVIRHDGTEAERRLVERRVVQPPVDRVVAVGILQSVSRGGEELRFSRVMEMRATGYTTIVPGRNTASGIPPRRGIAAVDPGVIPFGTRLYVEGYGHALAADKGSAIKGNRIDLFFPTRAEALAWGVRYVKVYVLE